jgi:hypothetical protein
MVSTTTCIQIHIRGDGGEGVANFPWLEWLHMHPMTRVLSIHEQRRDITKGNPFDVTREVRPWERRA